MYCKFFLYIKSYKRKFIIAMSGRLGELLIILTIVFIFFGAGKLPRVMSELSKGFKNLRKNDEEPKKVKVKSEKK